MIQWTETVTVPRQFGPRPDQVFLDAVPEPRERLCGVEYQEGEAMSVTLPMCACSTYAVGACADCGDPVCGDHSELIADLRRCRTHAKQARGAAALAAAERRREAERSAAVGGLRPEHMDELNRRRQQAAVSGLTEEGVADSYWFWRQHGYNGIEPVAAEFDTSVSEVNRVINAAGRSGVFEARRPGGG